MIWMFLGIVFALLVFYMERDFYNLEDHLEDLILGHNPDFIDMVMRFEQDH